MILHVIFISDEASTSSLITIRDVPNVTLEE